MVPSPAMSSWMAQGPDQVDRTGRYARGRQDARRGGATVLMRVDASVRVEAGRDVSVAHRPGDGAEHVQATDNVVTQSQRHGRDRSEPGTQSLRHEHRPATHVGLKIVARHDAALADAVQARSLVVLQLEDLQEPG